jgi:hypothetical protein
MGAPPVDWEKRPTSDTGYRPPSYSEHRQRAQPQYPPQPATGYAQPPAQYPPGQYAQQPPPYQVPPAAPGYPGQDRQQQYPPQPGQYPPQQSQYPAQPSQYPAQPALYPPQQYPGQPGYPPQYQYGPPPQGYQQQPPYGAPAPGYPGQPPYPPYGAPPAQNVSAFKQPGGVLVLVGFGFAMVGMVSILVGNLVFTASAPVPCLILAFISGIIGTALGVAAWAKGNKGGKMVVGYSVLWIVVSVIIGLMWASVFG